MPYKNFQIPTLGQNARIKIPDINEIKMDLKYIIAVIVLYELNAKLVKLNALYIRNQFTLFKETCLSIKEIDTLEITVCEVVNKLSLVGVQ